MNLPLELKTRGISLPAELVQEIREKAFKFVQFYDRIVRCRVTVEGPGRHQGRKSHRIRIELTVPGSRIVVSRQKGDTLYEAIREAFNAAGRRLEDHVRRRRGFVKSHSDAPCARVVSIFPLRGYGFLQDPMGREIFFHENSVARGGFDRLKVGARVRFEEEMGELGPQAVSVRPHRGRRARKEYSCHAS